MKCHGCKHHRPAYEDCKELLGQVKCRDCGREWLASERPDCPKCTNSLRLIDLSDCENGPSVACPGRVEVVPEKVQGSLF